MRLAEKAINEPTRVNLLGNSIVLIAPKDSKIDNVTIGRASISPSSPATARSPPATSRRCRSANTPRRRWKSSAPGRPRAEIRDGRSVRAALTLVARGEAPLGIVYSTDAKVEPGVKIVGTFPADSHPPIIYPVAATTTANRKPPIIWLPAHARRPSHFRKIRLQIPGQPHDLMRGFDMFALDANGRRSSCRCGSPRSRRWWRRRSASRGWLLARRDFWGKSLLDAADPSAAGAAAGRHRLSAAADLRPARPGRRVARRPSRDRVRVPLDRRGAGLRRHVVSAAGAADPAVDRSVDRRLEQAAGRSAPRPGGCS
jgi:hypothetical protein